MESVEILELLSRYGIDAAILAVLSAGACIALEAVLFKKLKLSVSARKAVKLLPYLFGILFYSLYALVCNSGIYCLLESLSDIVRQGLAVGTLGYLMCLAAEKVAGGRRSSADAKAVKGMIEGYISQNEGDVARLLCKAAEEGDADGVKSILEENAAEGVTGEQTEEVLQLILSYFGIAAK